MDIRFKSFVRARRATKDLCMHIHDLKLSEAQAVIAGMCNYDSWAHLKRAAEKPDAQAGRQDLQQLACGDDRRRELSRADCET